MGFTRVTDDSNEKAGTHGDASISVSEQSGHGFIDHRRELIAHDDARTSGHRAPHCQLVIDVREPPKDPRVRPIP